MTTTAKLEDLLPPTAIAELNKLFANSTEPRAEDVKLITRAHAELLADKGCDPDYLAYAILYAYGQKRVR